MTCLLCYTIVILSKERRAQAMDTEHETVVLKNEDTWDAKLLESIIDNGGLEYFKNDALEYLRTYSHYVDYPDFVFSTTNYVRYFYQRLNRLLEKYGTDPQSQWYPYVCAYKELRDTGIFDLQNRSLMIPIKGTDSRGFLAKRTRESSLAESI